MNKNIHIPGLPKTPEPSDLSDIAASIEHPDVNKAGITTTKNGDWALLLFTKKGTNVPIRDIEEKVQSYPIIYQEDSDELPVARPAYPGLGE
jgi:hypothetical protein